MKGVRENGSTESSWVSMILRMVDRSQTLPEGRTTGSTMTVSVMGSTMSAGGSGSRTGTTWLPLLISLSLNDGSVEILGVLGEQGSYEDWGELGEVGERGGIGIRVEAISRSLQTKGYSS